MTFEDWVKNGWLDIHRSKRRSEVWWASWNAISRAACPKLCQTIGVCHSIQCCFAGRYGGIGCLRIPGVPR